MKQILFVDDEPLILEAFQRTLSPMYRKWNMRFANGGAQALNMLAEMPADVVISDMRMPEMNGAQLLNEVMRRHPQTVRLILSGFADLEMIMECIEGTHQFLAKPCSSQTLKDVVGRALDIGAWVNNENLREIVVRLRTLPSLPSLYFEILRQLESPESDLEKVGATIAKDPSMTAKMLQLVNSAFFGLQRQLTDPTEAVMQLGLETIKSLVLGIHVFSEFKAGGEAENLIRRLWQHSLATATTAQRIAQAERQPKEIVADAFTAGLLHDIGRLVLLANLPEQYTEALRRSRSEGVPLIDAERAVFGANHAEVGGYLLGLWGLPVALVEAAVFHHCPGKCSLRLFSPLAIVHAANVFTQEPAEGQAAALQAQLDQEYLTELGMWERAQGWRRIMGSGTLLVRAA